MENLFTDTSSFIDDEDIKNLEVKLNYIFPEAFVELYKKFNGGCPMLDWLPQSNGEPTIVQFFFPIQNKKTNSKEESIFNKYKKMTKIGVIPNYLIPFATDPGGNFYSLNMLDNTVYYSLVEEISHKEIYRTFDSFINSLTDENSAYDPCCQIRTPKLGRF